MRKPFFLLLAIFAFFVNSNVNAQLKADEKGIFIKSGTIFSTDGLVLTPSVDFELKNLTIVRASIPVNWPLYSSITRMYHFSSPVAFKGTMSLNYLSSELNGNNPSSLSVAYTAMTGSSNYKDYLLAGGSNVDTYNQYVSQLFSDAVNVSDVTAVASGFVIPPVTASGSTTFCKGSSVTLSTIAASSWQWYRDGVALKGATQRELAVTDSGDYAVQVVLASGIATMSDPVGVTVSPVPQGKIITDKPAEISLGDEITLIASGGKSYSWNVGDAIVTKQRGDSITIRPTKTTTCQLIVSNGTGCDAVETLVVNIANDYKMLKPNNMVTPNGDGKNDVWVVKNIDLYPNNEVRIFDRAGRVVFTQYGYNNTWDATFNGSPLPEDTYYYILNIDSGKGKLTGFISVVRD